jgi:hypothetical protein
MNEHGEPITPRDKTIDIIERAIATYIDSHLRTAAATGLEEKTVDQIRHLHLAEPWLPAVNAVNQIKAAGITFVLERDS